MNQFRLLSIIFAILQSKKGFLLYGSAQKYLQPQLGQWGAGNVYLLVLSSWKVNIAENPLAANGVVDSLASVRLWNFKDGGS